MAKKRFSAVKDMQYVRFIPPVWDPVPPWLELNEDLLKRFAKLEIEFKIKELEVHQQKLKAFGKMLG